MSNKIAQYTASGTMIMSVFAILFAVPLKLGEISAEAYAFLGIIIGSATTFLFLAKTKNNGSHVAKEEPDV